MGNVDPKMPVMINLKIALLDEFLKQHLNAVGPWLVFFPNQEKKSYDIHIGPWKTLANETTSYYRLSETILGEPLELVMAECIG